MMNKENDMEKLNIEERKIIHILLKHLMDQRNEIAYLKNKAGLNTDNNGIAKRRIGINKDDISTSLLGTGINKDDLSTSFLGTGINKDDLSTSFLGTGINKDDISNPKLGIGINNGDISNPKLGTGINNDDLSNPKLGTGRINDDLSNPKLGTGINNDDSTNPKERSAINDDDYGNSKKRIGINNLVEALSAMEGTTNNDDWLYSVFEEELIKAIEQYIANGNGQATLYTFYSDFLEAIADKNSLDEKLKNTKIIIQIEDTHILPAEIPADATSILRLQAAMNGQLSSSSKLNIYINIARELLFLHNNGTAKQAQLLKVTGMSVSGFAKHLPKVIQYGLIKSLPSKTYTLTDKSNHILLELFGVAKTE